MKHKIPLLYYKYDALEPYIDKTTMEIHYLKHHQTYVNNLNLALKNTDFEQHSIEKLIRNIGLINCSKKNIIRNNSGGHFNHTIFWKSLKKGTLLNGKLKKEIEKNFKDFFSFQKSFEQAAMSHFGSGWTWLVKKNKKLEIVSTNNQDNPLMGTRISGTSGYPILGIDLWEHAYYLKHQNRRLDYINDFWNVINWDEAEIRFQSI